ncbi:flavodoxin domain-containing protein [Neiella sp. HB171785]|uniref:Flavodoxin domain-containing protein n=1 Tax=Neiella litorisoli TaxID=2771431 RepID=A0A8J6QUZ3_9GAMM|nr:flavodoxin domain-containing protein [Neiella litorisoli]MBD1389713.1 flavodoxin domain-containing protein [Neiella litorisoli]
MTQLAIIVGSVYGGAADLAAQIQEKAQDKSIEVSIFDDATLQQVTDFTTEHWLVVTSTTGQGDLPPNIEGFYHQLNDTFPMLSDTKAAVLALGDSSYGETFCGAGTLMANLLDELGCQQLMPALHIDACEHFEAINGAREWIDDLLAQL